MIQYKKGSTFLNIAYTVFLFHGEKLSFVKLVLHYAQLFLRKNLVNNANEQELAYISIRATSPVLFLMERFCTRRWHDGGEGK